MKTLCYMLNRYLQQTWSHRWGGLYAAWFCALVGLCVIILAPQRYEASTLIQVDPTRIKLPTLLQTNTPDDYLKQIKTSLLTQNTLEQALRVLHLTSPQTTQTLEQQTEHAKHLYEELLIEPTLSASNTYLFKYRANTQEMATATVLAITQAVEQTQQTLEQTTPDTNTPPPLNQQIELTEKRLKTAETALNNARYRNFGNIDTGTTREIVTQMNELNQALVHAQLQLQEAETARKSIQQQISIRHDTPKAKPENNTPQKKHEEQIIVQRQRLENLRQNHPDHHPDVIEAKQKLAQLETTKQQEAQNNRSPSDNISSTQRPDVSEQLNKLLHETDINITELQTRIQTYESKLREIRLTTQITPQTDIEMSRLGREYETIRYQYEQLLAQPKNDINTLMPAPITKPSVSMLKALPTKQLWPSRLQLSIFVLISSFTFGFIIALILQFICPTFSDPHSLAKFSGSHVIGSISMITDEKIMNSEQKNRTYFTLWSGLLLITLAGLIVFTYLHGHPAKLAIAKVL